MAAVTTALLVGAAVVGAGATAYSAVKAEDRAKKDAAAQAKLVKEQETKIEEERKRQEGISQERKMRLQKTQLLTGSEQGLTGDTQASLLGGGK